jgi:hypothetical protein
MGVGMAEKPWVSSLSFEVSFPVRGKVLQAVMCDCEEEGDIRLRVTRDPSESWDYDAKKRESFFDVHGYDEKGWYLKVRPGDWLESDVLCSGYLRKVRANRIEMQGNVLMDGTRLIGRAQEKDDTHVEFDFGVFHADLGFEKSDQMRKVLKGERVKTGTYVETDVDVDVEVKRVGTKDEIVGGLRRRFPAGRGKR